MSAVTSLPQTNIFEKEEEIQPLLSSIASTPYKIPGSPTGYAKRALHATIARLLTCLVNEKLVDAYYINANDDNDMSSYIFAVPAKSGPEIWTTCSLISQKCHKPVLSKAPLSDSYPNVFKITFLDREDIGVCQWIQWDGFSQINPVSGPAQIMRLVSQWNQHDSNVVEGICGELDSSVENQAYAYANRPSVEPSILTSSALEWEQGIIEGHPFHPMHRTRYAIPPVKPIRPETDLFHPDLQFVAVPRKEINVEGDFEALLAPLYQAATATTAAREDKGSIFDHIDCDTELIMPVHPLQMPAVLEKFAFARQLPFSTPAQAQLSIRTMCQQELTAQGYNLKLPLGIKISSALRTVSPWSTYVGPRVTRAIPDILKGAPVKDALLIAGEPASAVSTNSDFDIAKYLSCVVRDDCEFICRPRGERVILTAALTNYTDDGTSMVVKQWGLDTRAKRLQFLQSYTDMLFDAYLPPVMRHGFALEAHQQNSLLRIDEKTGQITGFIVRDFGGIKVHRPTFRKSTGIDIDMLDDSCTDAYSLYEVYDLAYHTLIQCNLHSLVRALKLHYSGDGWSIVRQSFSKRVPELHPLRQVWYQETFDLKCMITMKLDGLYRDYIYTKVPNVLFYKNEEEGVVFPPTNCD